MPIQFNSKLDISYIALYKENRYLITPFLFVSILTPSQQFPTNLVNKLPNAIYSVVGSCLENPTRQ